MKVLLDLPEDTLNKFKLIASKERRSRKVCMEMVLISYHKIADFTPNNSAKNTNLSFELHTLSQLETYENEMLNADNLDELEMIGKEIENDKKLTGIEKFKLKQIGITCAIKFNN